MGDRTAIEWTDATWNPTVGCTRVSPGCDNCYAERQAPRQRFNLAYEGVVGAGGWTGRVNTVPSRLDQPLRWRESRLVFVDSMSDLFHPSVPLQFIADVFAVMAIADQHQFQVLTKRPQRMAQIVASDEFHEAMRRSVWARDTHLCGGLIRPNIWLGASIEDDRYTFRANHVRATPAAIRFLSCEPLLGPLPSLDLDGIDWVIAGGESGPCHRPVHPDWIRDLRDRCVDAGVAFHFKQWGGRTAKLGGRELDGRTWDEFPVGAL